MIIIKSGTHPVSTAGRVAGPADLGFEDVA